MCVYALVGLFIYLLLSLHFSLVTSVSVVAGLVFKSSDKRLA